METMPLAIVTVPSPLSTTVTLAPVPVPPPGIFADAEPGLRNNANNKRVSRKAYLLRIAYFDDPSWIQLERDETRRLRRTAGNAGVLSCFWGVGALENAEALSQRSDSAFKGEHSVNRFLTLFYQFLHILRDLPRRDLVPAGLIPCCFLLAVGPPSCRILSSSHDQRPHPADPA